MPGQNAKDYKNNGQLLLYTLIYYQGCCVRRSAVASEAIVNNKFSVQSLTTLRKQRLNCNPR
jgi:hypothetical protein